MPQTEECQLNPIQNLNSVIPKIFDQETVNIQCDWTIRSSHFIRIYKNLIFMEYVIRLE